MSILSELVSDLYRKLADHAAKTEEEFNVVKTEHGALSHKIELKKY